ncbi:MAG: hypothetical protein LBM08_05980 [Dysgonamonadaceae bacterium]|jgi:hypothetical protein|nr:hypothetical protein [Dysgonamonadaceae bacterium]
MLRSTVQSGTDVILVARCETSGWVPDSLYRSGESPIYYRRIHQAEPGRRIKQMSRLRHSGTCHGQSPDVSHRATKRSSVPDFNPRVVSTFQVTKIGSVLDSQVLRNIS